MALKNSEYWKKRFSDIEGMTYKTAEQAYAEIAPAFDAAQREVQKQIEAWYGRFAANNQITMAEARKWLSTSELAELKWDVKDYIKYGTENDLNAQWIKQLENASAKFHISRLEALQLQTQQAIEKAFGNELDVVDSMIKTAYTDSFYHSMYEMQNGFGVGWDVSAINSRTLEQVIKKPWAADGRAFSDRIWGSKQGLLSEVQNQLTRTIALGKAPDDAIKAISKKFGATKYQAGRLVQTESAYFSSAAQKECYDDLDVEKYQVVCTFDKETCPICSAMDGQIFDQKDYAPGITAHPFHPNCRCDTIPYFDDWDELGISPTRAARDENSKTYQVPKDMKYDDWKKSFVDGGSKEGLTELPAADTITLKRSIKDCSTVDEVQELMKSNGWFNKQTINGVEYDSNDGLHLSGCDLEAAKAVYTSHEQLFEKYPQLVGKLNSITTAPLSRNTYAQCSVGLGHGGISVNEHHYGDASKLASHYASDVAAGFHPVGTDYTAIVTHELGHAIDDYLTNTLRTSGMVNSWKPKWVSADLRPKVMKACGLKVSDTFKQVSGYATKDHFEWFAECFAEYMKSDAPREVATEFGKQLEEILKGVT